MASARLLAALLALGTALAADLGAQVVVGPRTTAIPVVATGDTIVVPVVADMSGGGGASLGSVTARLHWRPNTLRFIGMSAGTFGAPAINNDSAGGELRFAAASASGAGGTPTLINARFQAIGPVGDTTTLLLTVDEMSAAGTLAPLTSVATAALVCVGSVGGRWGDVTGDDAVLSNDALVIVTHAVGLSIAPFTVINGDVDNSGAVTSRDALIVLSHAVGLNVSSFRVNQVRPSLCGTGTPPTSVALTPGTAQLRPGDRLPLGAVARDASLAVVHTAGVSWLSRNAAVASVDAAGEVTGVAAGITRIVAVVAPGVMDSVTVSVAAGQRVWFVNGAHSNPVEHGSQAFPFSAIAQALASAAADDTIRISVATYGEQLKIFKPLTILGDSTAQGFPRVRPTSGAAILVDSVGGGTVILRRLEIPDADGAVYARGGGGLLEIDRVRITNSRAIALIVKRFGTLLVTGGGVTGAINTGLEVDSTDQVLLLRTTIDMVSGSGPGSPGYRAVVAQHGTVFTLDSSTLRGGRNDVRGFRDVSLRSSRLGDSHGPMLAVTGADSVNIFATQFIGNQNSMSTADTGGVLLGVSPAGIVLADSMAVSGPIGVVTRGGRRVSLRRLTTQSLSSFGTAGARLIDADSAMVTRSNLSGGELRFELTVPGTGALALMDTVVLTGAGAKVTGYRRLLVHGGTIDGATDNGLFADDIDNATVERLEVRNTRLSSQFFGDGPFAIHFQASDTILADSVWIHDNGGGAFQSENADTVAVFRSRLDASYLGAGSGNRTSIRLIGARRMRLARTRVDDRLGAPFLGMLTAGFLPSSSMIIDSTTFAGPYSGSLLVSGQGSSGSDTLIMRSSALLAGGAPRGSRFMGLRAQSMKWVEVTGSVFDTISADAIRLEGGASSITGNVIREAGYGIADYRSFNNTIPALVSGNQITCPPNTGATGVFASGASLNATGNTVTTCGEGIRTGSSLAGIGAVIRQNTLLLDSNALVGIGLFGYFSTVVEVAGNDVSVTGAGSVLLGGIKFDQAIGQWNNPRADSNVIHDMAGDGIWIFGVSAGLKLRGNLIHTLGNRFGGTAGIRLDLPFSGAELTANTVRQVKGVGIEVLAALSTVRLDSNTIVEDSAGGIQVFPGGHIAGRYNRIGRNSIGLSGGFGSMDSSAFEGNTVLGADVSSSWTLSNNWWGHPSGPRCGTGCPGALGDSVAGGITAFTPVLADSVGGRIPNGAGPIRPVAGAPPAAVRAANGAPPLPAERRRPSAAVIAARARPVPPVSGSRP